MSDEHIPRDSERSYYVVGKSAPGVAVSAPGASSIVKATSRKASQEATDSLVMDTSAVIAILQGDAESSAFIGAITRAMTVHISAASALEASILMHSRYGEQGDEQLDLFLQAVGATVEPLTADQLAFARQGWRRFGKGRHPANLNFGDCLAYALAKALSLPLLFTGSDFRKTDVRSALD